ncbi:MAG: nucleoside-diphosphate kinase [Chthoniobacterales bacterium]|jgi:nucleoside diphosphate kinase
MNNTLSYLLVSPEALRRGWTGWILSGATARTGGLDLVWAGLVEVSGDRAGLLVFHGEDAVAKLSSAVGAADEAGSLAAMLGPGMVSAPRPGSNVAAELAKLAAAQIDPLAQPVASGAQRSLVLIKPDNFQFPGTRPGAVLDVFARTGLPLAAMKVHHMSVAEGMEFYGPVLDALSEKFGPEKGRDHWESIVEFMSGTRPSAVPAQDHHKAGTQKILALVFEGPEAVTKIRTVLGPTDPAKAPPGTIRKEFGASIMVNAAHASDSPENALREIGIVKVADNSLKRFVESAATSA